MLHYILTLLHCIKLFSHKYEIKPVVTKDKANLQHQRKAQETQTTKPNKTKPTLA